MEHGSCRGRQLAQGAEDEEQQQEDGQGMPDCNECNQQRLSIHNRNPRGLKGCKVPTLDYRLNHAYF